ncbi:MAG: hypothetical protein ACOYON_11800 [Fimbriimonas sp.]
MKGVWMRVVSLGMVFVLSFSASANGLMSLGASLGKMLPQASLPEYAGTGAPEDLGTSPQRRPEDRGYFWSPEERASFDRAFQIEAGVQPEVTPPTYYPNAPADPLDNGALAQRLQPVPKSDIDPEGGGTTGSTGGTTGTTGTTTGGGGGTGGGTCEHSFGNQ